MVQVKGVNSLSYDGSEWNQLLILPLPRAGDTRCSVNRASRTRNRPRWIQLSETNPCSISLMPPRRLQASVTKLGKHPSGEVDI
ncbi:hypothetical protein E1A91_A07G027500v1 [Gossypium mustelinum]|uniref:Uncharacterized protein n=1 Tax=Gossypium mustelinum TaxID=34275 RepID=A0A5D2YFX8_GOSMU|nr:hypothetical protein E1A91_A07G027500v1 [Gossypium mustelinum]